MGPKERVWGYTGATGLVQGFSAGYFLWDLVISAENLDVLGPGSLMHAASALAVSLLGFVRARRHLPDGGTLLTVFGSAHFAITTV